LLQAAWNGYPEVAAVLLDSGAALEARNVYGASALILAAWGGYEAVVRVLLDHGADMGHAYADPLRGEVTALSIARAEGHSRVAALLERAGSRR
jgi:ankyrin repeat protein